MSIAKVIEIKASSANGIEDAIKSGLTKAASSIQNISGAWVKDIKVVTDGNGKLHTSSGRRNFCRNCGAFLWLYDPSWPKLVHPFASAIDTPLPKAPERVHMMLAFKAPWCVVPRGKRDVHCDEYPRESLEQW